MNIFILTLIPPQCVPDHRNHIIVIHFVEDAIAG